VVTGLIVTSKNFYIELLKEEKEEVEGRWEGEHDSCK